MDNRICVISISTQNVYIADFLKFYIDALCQFCSCVYLIADRVLDYTNLNHDNLLVENSLVGTDFDRYSYVIDQHKDEFCGKKIIFTNDSVYGPIYPLDEMWDKMCSRYDFWGVTKHQRTIISDEFFPEYVHTYFFVIESFNALKCFHDYCLSSINDTSCEIYMTEYMIELGFSCGVYCNTDFISNIDERLSEPFHLVYPFYIVSELKSPFVCRYTFRLTEELRDLYGIILQNKKIIDFISDFYDINYIFADQLFQQSPYELINTFDLLLISDERKLTKHENVAVFVYLYYETDFNIYLNRLKSISGYIDIICFTDTCAKKELILELAKQRQIELICEIVSSDGREWNAFCNHVGKYCKKYDVGCFLHDKSFHINEFPTQAYEFRDMLWDNLLNSSGVESIIEYFNKEKIGLVLPPIEKHGSYFKYYCNYWMNNFSNTVKLLENLRISNYMINENESPISIGGMFWFRFSAIKQLFTDNMFKNIFPSEPMDTDGTINHSLERAIPYIAQGNGFYSAITYCRDYLVRDSLFESYMLKKYGNKFLGQKEWISLYDFFDEKP